MQPSTSTAYFSPYFSIICFIRSFCSCCISKKPYLHSNSELSVYKMLEGKAVVRESDMPPAMQIHVMELACKALDLHEVSDCRSIAHYIKQKFDEAYGPAWHCVVGKNFGSCITHLFGSFIFFHVEMTEFLIFKDGKATESREEAVGVLQIEIQDNYP